MDEEHALLPAGTLNTFLEVKTLSDSITSWPLFDSSERTNQVSVSKVMFCDSRWIKEYFVDPFLRYQRGAPILEVEATPVENDDGIPYAIFVETRAATEGEDHRTTSIQEQEDRENQSTVAEDSGETDQHGVHNQGVVVTPIHMTHYENASFEVPCSCCRKVIRTSESPIYACTVCSLPEATLCHQCYNLGYHDHTHSFERICHESIETIPSRVQPVDFTDWVPDVPLAVAVPLKRKFQPPADDAALSSFDTAPNKRFKSDNRCSSASSELMTGLFCQLTTS